MENLIIKYLTYFFEYLNDENFKGLFKLIYGKDDYFNNFSSYKEMFLSIFFSAWLNVEKRELQYIDVLESKHEYEDEFLPQIEDIYSQEIMTEEDKDFIEEINDISIYYYLIQKYNYIHDDNYIKIIFGDTEHDDTEVELLTNEYNKQIFKIQKTEKAVLNYIKYIALSINSFELEPSLIADKGKFKDFLNGSISKIISDKYCYFINRGELEIIKFNPIKNANDNIQSETYYLKEDNGKIIISDSLHKYPKTVKYYTSIVKSEKERSIRGISDLKSYLNKYKYLDMAIEELKTKIQYRYCHICYTYDEHKNNAHKCSNCEDIFRIIKEIYQEQLKNEISTNKIIGRIKQRYEDEKSLNIEQKRERHYVNLCSFINEIESNVTKNTNNNTEKIKLLRNSVDKAFKQDKQIE